MIVEAMVIPLLSTVLAGSVWVVVRQKQSIAALKRSSHALSSRLNEVSEQCSRETHRLEGVVRELPIPAVLMDPRTKSILSQSPAAEQDANTQTVIDEHVKGAGCDIHEIPLGPRVLYTWGKGRALRGGNETDSDRENRIIKSILNEPNVIKGIEMAFGMLASDVPDMTTIIFRISVLDQRTNRLRKLWSKESETTGILLNDHEPLVFGQSPGVAAALLGKEVAEYRESITRPQHPPSTLPAGIVLWRSVPVVSSRGEVLGTFDVLLTDRQHLAITPDRLSNFLFVVSILLERHRSLSEMVTQARVDRLVKRITERMLSVDAAGDCHILRECTSLLQDNIDMDAGLIGVAYQNDQGGLACTGPLFTESNAAAMGIGRLVHHLRDLSGFLPEKDHVDEHKDLPPVISAASIRDTPLADIARVFGAHEQAAEQSWAIFPMIAGGQTEGAVFLTQGCGLSDAQRSLLSIAAPIFASHIARTRLLKALERKAQHDQLTGLFNRGHTEELLRSEIERSLRYRNNVSVVLFDIDHFKLINDTFGHEAGDRVLKEVSARVQQSLRSVDLLGRWGGEEFLAILPETQRSSAMHVAEAIRQTIEQGNYGIPKPVTVSLGVAQFRANDSMDVLVRRADEALYKAKGNGRNQVVCE